MTRVAVVRDGQLICDEPAAAAVSREPVSGPGRCTSVVMFLRTALLVLKKDVAIEVKSLEILSTTLFFAISCVLIFSFALVGQGGRGDRHGDGAGAILWIAVAFAGVLGLGRAFERERYGETLKALLLAPAPRPAIYVGKLLGHPAAAVHDGAAARADDCLRVPRARSSIGALLLAGLLATGTIGFAAVGTLVRRHARALALARDHVADPAVSDYDSSPDRGRQRHVGAAERGPERADRDDVAGRADVVRRRVRDAGAVDVRAAHDGVEHSGHDGREDVVSCRMKSIRPLLC